MEYVVKAIREKFEENVKFWKDLLPGLKEEEYVKLAYITLHYCIRATFNF